MPYVEVDVDLDVFDTDDLVTELTYRIKKAKLLSKKAKDDKALQALIQDYEELADLCNRTSKSDTFLTAENLDDVMKIEHLKKVLSDYSVSEIENLLPKK